MYMCLRYVSILLHLFATFYCLIKDCIDRFQRFVKEAIQFLFNVSLVVEYEGENYRLSFLQQSFSFWSRIVYVR